MVHDVKYVDSYLSVQAFWDVRELSIVVKKLKVVEDDSAYDVDDDWGFELFSTVTVACWGWTES